MTNPKKKARPDGIPISEGSAAVVRVLQGSDDVGSEAVRQALEESLLMTRDEREGGSLDYQLYPAVVTLRQLRRYADELAVKAKGKEREKTTAARAALEARAAAGETKRAQAKEALRRMQRRGEKITERHISNSVAVAVGCNPKTVRAARKELLAESNRKS